ncbi:BCCT family transporter [Tateyamaria omphalii]|uniref:Glycine/betaine ABC transporter n=1 Tax=Tateyamaria omphalii TaxID=299262 RepID=A0A1P8MTQ7_9RHOB|nr:BCCT family transporter [Tateyamaria omphalii]APX11421.1 glycine/betaine ABC transporter [Tateyamaria omphalii]
MAIREPFTDLEINTQESGFYEGHSLPIALISKITMVALVLWAILWPAAATQTLDAWNWATLQGFNAFYIISVGFFAFFLFVLAALPVGKRKLGGADTQTEFSTFSWFAMMFGAGLGVGLMVFATAEPVGLWGSNPVIVAQGADANSPEAVQSAFRYALWHFGIHAWAIYVITGLSLAYYAYTRDMPLTIRSALTPLLGRAANGFLGHVVDVLGVVATILGVAVTIGYGVSQFVDGVYNVTGMEWLMGDAVDGAAPKPSTVGLITALAIIMGMSILSAVSGVGRGIKYLSNLNLVLSMLLLLTFIVFGSFIFALTTYGTALADYIWNFIPLSFEAYSPLSQEAFTAALPAEAEPVAGALYSGATNAWGSYDGFVAGLEGDAAALDPSVQAAAYEAGTQGRLFGWQSGWTTFYWAWWIAFSPFVGLFLARISKGRTVREFILGCMIAPALVCFAWLTILGGTAVNNELLGVADGAIVGASNTNKLFVSLAMIVPDWLLGAVIVMCVVLIMTFLVTSADSGILVMNTIMSGGAAETGIKHRIIWGLILTGVIGSLLVAGAIDPNNADALAPLQDAMIVGALPFTFVMVLMAVALAKALINDSRRERANDAVGQPAE